MTFAPDHPHTTWRRSYQPSEDCSFSSWSSSSCDSISISVLSANSLGAPLSGGVHNCCNFPSNFSDPAGGNTSCPCASCTGMCGMSGCWDGVKPAAGGGNNTNNTDVPGLGEGGGGWASFPWVTVGGVWAAVVVVGLGSWALGW